MADDVIAGRYRLLRRLGRGAMSSVWLAEDPELARQVAVKLLAPTADRARFEREARMVATLSHPHVGALYDYGEADGKPYMVLEYLPGGSLEERLAGGARLADEETRRIAGELASGLAHAHERGLVHRDLKPANVLFDAEGRSKIVDFGIARMGDAGTLTEAGTVLGTASTISPEQAAGLPATTASDVYSFGVLLFRMLTGRLPFAGENALELVRMHRDEAPPSVADVRPDAPADLAALADASLAKDPSTRPADGAALGAALAGGAAAPAGVTGATRVMPRARPRRRLSPLVPAAVVAGALVGAGAALAVLLTKGGSAAPGSSVPSLSLPAVGAPPATQPHTTTRAPAPTTAPTTTAATRAATTAVLPTVPTTTRRVTTSTRTTTPIAPPPPPTTLAPTTTTPLPTLSSTTAPATTVATTTTPATTAAG